MPFSLEKQLKLFDSGRFEELCGQLVNRDFPESRHVEGAGGDKGIDIFVGELNKVARAQSGSKLRVWQAKFFRDGVKSKQRKQAEHSLERVIEQYEPDFWTLCVPVNLSTQAQEWFESLKVQHPNMVLDVWQASEIIRRVRQDDSLIDSYFLRQQPEIHGLLEGIRRVLEDFESVPDILSRTRRSSRDASYFYDGNIPVWSDIVQKLDAPREQFGRLWHFVASHINSPGGRVPFALVTGRGGDGKSTVLMRLAAQLVDQGYELVFYCKDDAKSLRADQFCGLHPDNVYVVIVDNISRFDAETIQGFFDRLCRESIPIIVVGAARLSLWEGLNLMSTLANVADICEVNLEEITDDDIEALLDKWSADPSHASEHLGALAGLPRQQQVARFREKAKKQLLVALLEVKHNEALEAVVHQELDALEMSQKVNTSQNNYAPQNHQKAKTRRI